MDNDKMQQIYEAAQAIEQDFEYEYLDLLDVFHEADPVAEEDYSSSIPQYRVLAVVDVVENNMEGSSIFTGPLCDFGRDQGLYVYDHIVKVGYEVESFEPPQADYDTEAISVVRFGLED